MTFVAIGLKVKTKLHYRLPKMTFLIAKSTHIGDQKCCTCHDRKFCPIKKRCFIMIGNTVSIYLSVFADV